MITATNDRSRWCIVVADEPKPAWGVARPSRVLPVQFARWGEAATPYQRALHRAAALAPAPQVLVTVGEEQRLDWEPASWFVRPERRYVSASATLAPLTLAAAVLAIAAQNESDRIIILPAGSIVTREPVLKRTLESVLEALPHVPEGIASLGMIEPEDAIDEDYLLVSRPRAGSGLAVRALARRPVAWVARHLKDRGALIASGILIGYAGAFAAHLEKVWPVLSERLARQATEAALAGRECGLTAKTLRGLPPVILGALRWQPPALAQRVFAVVGSGWSSLKTPRAIAHRARFIARAARWAFDERTPTLSTVPSRAPAAEV